MCDRLHVPERILLPSTVLIAHQHMLVALGVSSRVLHYWRVRHGFPKPIRDGRRTFSITSEIETWLRTRGVNVEVI